MAEGDVTFLNSYKKHIGDGTMDWDADTIKVALLNGWTPDIDTDEFWSDISANEISATNYTAGGQALTGAAITVDTTNDWAKYDANDPSWTSLGAATVTRAAFYKDTGTPSTSPLICAVEIATNPNGGNYSLVLGANGLFTVS